MYLNCQQIMCPGVSNNIKLRIDEVKSNAGFYYCHYAMQRINTMMTD